MCQKRNRKLDSGFKRPSSRREMGGTASVVSVKTMMCNKPHIQISEVLLTVHRKSSRHCCMTSRVRLDHAITIGSNRVVVIDLWPSIPSSAEASYHPEEIARKRSKDSPCMDRLEDQSGQVDGRYPHIVRMGLRFAMGDVRLTLRSSQFCFLFLTF